MALTVNRVRGPERVGNIAWCSADITFDSSYNTGGESLVNTDLGFNTEDKFQLVSAGSASGLAVGFDYAASKLKAYASIDGTIPYSYVPGGGDIKGATAITGAMGTTDQAGDVVNPGMIFAYQSVTTIAGASGSFGSVTAQPAIARNVVIQARNGSGGNLNLALSMPFTVVGTFRGAAQTEVITATVTAPQQAVAHAPDYRAWAGVKPFDTITSVTLDATVATAMAVADGAINLAVAPGVKLGLPINTATGADADIIHFSLNALNRSVSGNFDYTNKTMNVGTIADGDDVAVVYNAAIPDSAGTRLGNAVLLAEVPASTDLSTISVRVLAFAAK